MFVVCARAGYQVSQISTKHTRDSKHGRAVMIPQSPGAIHMHTVTTEHVGRKS